MFTHKDISVRTIFVVNCINERNLKVKNGELFLEEIQSEGDCKTLTKIPFQKVLALFVIGQITITTPLIDNCKKYNVALIVMKPNLRPVFYWSDSAEANFLLRHRQHLMPTSDITVASAIINSKISNQIALLKNTRKKDSQTIFALEQCVACLNSVSDICDRQQLLGVEGIASKSFFKAYFQDYDWTGRKPRTRTDIINASLDIGYTLLFNFIESYLRMFGFDLYIGVYHTQWFKRKSLVCDIMEPFRCIIDRTVRTGLNRRQIREEDFEKQLTAYNLKRGRSADYYRMFFDAMIPYKVEIFNYVQAYYRCFMGRKSVENYPIFNI